MNCDQINWDFQQKFNNMVVLAQQKRELIKQKLDVPWFFDKLNAFGTAWGQGSAFEGPLYHPENPHSVGLTCSDVDVVLCVGVDIDFSLLVEDIKSEFQGQLIIHKIVKNLIMCHVNTVPVDILVVQEEIIHIGQEECYGFASLVEGGINYTDASRSLVSVAPNYVQVAIAILKAQFPESTTTFWKIGSLFVESKFDYIRPCAIDNLLICLAEFCNFAKAISLCESGHYSTHQLQRFKQRFGVHNNLSPYKCITEKHRKFVQDNMDSILDWMWDCDFIEEYDKESLYSRYCVPKIHVSDLVLWSSNPEEAEWLAANTKSPTTCKHTVFLYNAKIKALELMQQINWQLDRDVRDIMTSMQYMPVQYKPVQPRERKLMFTIKKD